MSSPPSQNVPTAASHSGPTNVRLQWGIKATLRDGVNLHVTAYLPRQMERPRPCIVTLTPYVAQLWHSFGLYFASHGYPFLAVDCRGRGNSEGTFRPMIQEAEDGHDLVEWVARQPFCNGKVAMWGGSYGGYNQWATASRNPHHLSTIVPVAAVYPAHTFPMRANVTSPYAMQWLTFVSGKTSQDRMFFEGASFWAEQYQQFFESGAPFMELDAALGNPSPVFREWVDHPTEGAYWDAYVPTKAQRARLSIPVLTITGLYDSDQPGALRHFREHVEAAPNGRSSHYLIIGPWHHAGTRVPRAEFAGLKLGPASLLDLPKLHLDWYAWTLEEGPKPAFLQKSIAYYVLGAERWRYADTLEGATGETRTLYLDSNGAANRVFGGGVLSAEPARGREDTYIYDPRDVRVAAVEASLNQPLCLRPTLPTDDLTDQRMVFASEGQQLVYHSAPFDEALEIAGFFRLEAWLSIDTPDTDFRADIYALDARGQSLLLTSAWIRARYRESLREEKLIGTTAPLRYDFNSFTFVAIALERGSRLRLVVGPINSIFYQRNHNSGGVVAGESMRDARPVRVALHHDQEHPSALYVPIGVPGMEDPTAGATRSIFGSASAAGTP